MKAEQYPHFPAFGSRHRQLLPDHALPLHRGGCGWRGNENGGRSPWWECSDPGPGHRRMNNRMPVTMPISPPSVPWWIGGRARMGITESIFLARTFQLYPRTVLKNTLHSKYEPSIRHSVGRAAWLLAARPGQLHRNPERRHHRLPQPCPDWIFKTNTKSFGRRHPPDRVGPCQAEGLAGPSAFLRAHAVQP